MCDSKPGLLCTRCQSCRYCSKECQAADWSSHRLLCKKYAERSSPPSESHRLAIEFPQEKRNPRLIWVLCEKKFDDGPRERAFVSAFLGKDNPNSGHRLVRRNPRRDRDLINTIEVVFRDTFLIDGSKPNRSLYNAVGSTSHDWRGPSVVLRKKGLSRDPNFYADISLADYRHVLDYFATYGDDNVSVLEQGINPPTRSYNAVLGVKVTCFGEQKLHSAKPFVQVLVPVTHVERNNLYPEGEISPISRLVGLPIRAWKFTTKGEWQNRADWEFNMHPDSNLTASKLFMEPEICSPGWGWAPMCWQTGIGNVLLLRADDTDLLVEDAELLCRFCEWKLQPLFEDALGGGRTHRSKQEVVDFITMDNMGKFRTELATRLKNDGA